MDSLQGKRILLGVSGGVSAFKALLLLRLLMRAGASVDVIMTEAATRFVGKASFEAFTSRKVVVDLFDEEGNGGGPPMPHLELAESADLALVVPATANTLAKMAHGIADNALLTALLSVTAPVLVAPAMDADMWRHPATQENIAILRRRGVRFIGPVEGELARRNVGPGRLAEPEAIAAEAARILGAPVPSDLPLVGKRVIVTAGGTREPLDAVRFITNRSSGKMGFALAEAALELGAEVCLITGPVALAPPAGAEVVQVETALEMRDAVLSRLDGADVVVMAAAVADYRPEGVVAGKRKKSHEPWLIKLVENPDIAAEIGRRKRPGQVLVAFAAESEALLANARKKLQEKGADLVVANDITRAGSGFDVDTNEVTLLFATGEEESLPLMSKRRVAEAVMARIARIIGRTATSG